MRIEIRRYESGVVGLPADGRVIPVANSTLGLLTCLKKLWFSDVEGLGFSTFLQGLGTSWHDIQEDVFRWWMETDSPYRESGLDSCLWCKGAGWVGDGSEPCEHCKGTGDGPLRRTVDKWSAVHEGDEGGQEIDFDEVRERLYNSAIGYLLTYHNGPLDTMEVVGVEESLARPILSRSGKPYRTTSYLRYEASDSGPVLVLADTASIPLARETGGILAPLATASPRDVAWAQWPVYQIGRLDAILRDRRTAAGWVLDTKYTGHPLGYLDRMATDPQLPGYCWLLEAHMERYGLSEVSGFIYDITKSTHQKDPDTLKWKPPKLADLRRMAEDRGVEVSGRKSEDYMAALGITEGHGGFSRKKSTSTPSWRYRWAVERAGLDVEDYAEHLELLEETVDPGLYRRFWETYSERDRDVYAAEVRTKAAAVTAARRAAARVESPLDVSAAFPRTPVCALPGGSCAYSGICSQDSVEGRERFDRLCGVRWHVREDGPEIQKDSNDVNIREIVGF